MRVHAASESFAVTAIAGTKCVRFTFDGTEGSLNPDGRFLGFVIRRVSSTRPDHCTWLRSHCKQPIPADPLLAEPAECATPADVDQLADALADTHIAETSGWVLVSPEPDPNPASTELPPSDVLNSPIQDFRWCDFSAQPGAEYVYTIMTVYGTETGRSIGNTVDITIETEPEGAHGGEEVYFNRGVAGSQSYTQRFGAGPRAKRDKDAEDPWPWLSRGLEEALVGFISRATGPEFTLLGACYEVHFSPSFPS